MDGTKDSVAEHNARAARYYAVATPILEAMSSEQAADALAAWKAGRRGADLGAAMSGLFQVPDVEFPEAFGNAAVTRALEIVGEYDEELRPNPQNEERVLMGEFEQAKLYYVPARHTYRVELGDLFEEFRAGWEPVFGIDVADAQVAEEVLDRLLAASASR
ncbi:hypothetical protein D3C71_175170 [compost metagenome]